MKQRIYKLIEEAKRELRVASGIPLTQEELAADIADKAKTAFEDATARDLGLEIRLELYPEICWDGKAALAKFTVDETPFELRLIDGRYFLTRVDREDRVPPLDPKDPLFRSRFLTSLGDLIAGPT
jgi:hypothetical protein